MGGGIRVCLNFSPALFPNCKPIKSGLWCCPDPNKTTIHEFTDQVRTHFKLPVEGPASLQLLWNKQYTLPEDGIVADLVRDGEVLDVLPASQPLNEAIAALNRAPSDPSRQDDSSLGVTGKAPSGLLLDGPAAFGGDAQAAAGGVGDSAEGAAPPLDPTLTMYMQAFLQGVTLQTMQGAPPGAAGLVANASKNGGLAGGLGLRGQSNVDEDSLPRDVTDADGGNPLKRKHSMNGGSGRYPQSPGQAESSQDTVDAGAAEDEDDPEYHPGMTRDSPTRPRPAKRRSMKGREGQPGSGNGLNGSSAYSTIDPIGLQALIAGDGGAPAMPGLGLEQLAEAAALAALQPGGAQASQALLSLQGLSQAMPQAAGTRQAGNDPEVDEPGTSGTSSKAKTGELAVTSSGRPRKPSQKALTSGDDDDDLLGKKSSGGGGGVSKESSGKCLITLDRLRQVYHLNIEDAAKELGIGMTKLKEHCRQLGIPRWPSRKLRSMDKLIESLGERAHLDPHTQQVVEDVIRELARFKQMIYEDPSIEVEEEIKRLRQSNFKKEYQQRQQLARQVPGTSSGGSLGGLAALGAGVPRPQSPVFDKSVLSFDRSQAQFDPTRANITFDPARAPQAFADLTRHSSYDLQ